MFSDLFFSTISIIIIGILFIAFASLAESLEFYERYLSNNPLTSKRYNSLWHLFQLLERFFAILFGFSLASSNNPISHLLFVAALFWLIYDASLNFVKNKNLFYVSSTSGNFLEKYSSFPVKLGFLSITIILLILNLNF